MMNLNNPWILFDRLNQITISSGTYEEMRNAKTHYGSIDWIIVIQESDKSFFKKLKPNPYNEMRYNSD